MGSKRRPSGNGADRGCNITPRESGRLPSGLAGEKVRPTAGGGKQRTAAATLAGAASPGNRQRPRRSIVQSPSLVAEAGVSNEAFAKA